MQLTTARLCLNCDEVHDAYACPVCVSDKFVYLTRWVPLSHPESAVVRRSVAATVPQPAAAGGGVLNLITTALRVVSGRPSPASTPPRAMPGSGAARARRPAAALQS